MWMWTDEEKLTRFVKIAQKWIEYHSRAEDIPEDALQIGFSRTQQSSQKIIKELGIESAEVSGVLSSWIEIGYFAGFINGWKDSSKIATKGGLPALTVAIEGLDLMEKTTQYAHKFATEFVDIIFSKLTEPPVSVLIQGLTQNKIDLLKIVFESSLYAGYLDGVEHAYRYRSIDNLSGFTDLFNA
jgi:hypothetical protein